MVSGCEFMSWMVVVVVGYFADRETADVHRLAKKHPMMTRATI
jgi:hypothetical protein